MLQNNTEVAKCEHSKRLQCIDKEVIGPREEAVSNEPYKTLCR